MNRLCPSLRYYPEICLEGLRKIGKTLIVHVRDKIRNRYLLNISQKFYCLSQLAR
jgi:hypothetical protein